MYISKTRYAPGRDQVQSTTFAYGVKFTHVSKSVHMRRFAYLNKFAYMQINAHVSKMVHVYGALSSISLRLEDTSNSPGHVLQNQVSLIHFVKN